MVENPTSGIRPIRCGRDGKRNKLPRDRWFGSLASPKSY